MSDEIKIETGVPVPTVGLHSMDKYPFDKLEVGNSFLVNLNGIASTSVYCAVSRRNGNLKPKRFASRSVFEGGNKAIRVWRVA